MNNALKSQRGATLIVALLLVLVVGGIYYMARAARGSIKKTEPNKAQIALQKKKACQAAVKKISLALEKDHSALGAYPYEFDYEFFERHKDMDRYIHNTELWTDESGNTARLDTMFGTEFTLTGSCKNGKDYTYSSNDKTIVQTRRDGP